MSTWKRPFCSVNVWRMIHDNSIQIWEREENCFVLIEAWWRNIKFTKIRDCQRTSCWQFFEITPPILQVDGSRIANMKSQLNLHLSKSTPHPKKGDPRTLRLLSNNDAVSALIGIFDWSLLGRFASSGSHGLCEPRNASLGAAGATTNGEKKNTPRNYYLPVFPFSFLLQVFW